MPFYKYTVANIEGRKLSGTVEAPSEQTARNELNNLGFSILQLNEVVQSEKVQDSAPKFIFEAIDKNSQQITGTMPGSSKELALKKLEEEYELTITAIWQEGADNETIQFARNEGQKHLQNRLNRAEEAQEEKIKNLEQQKEEQFVKNKIEKILSEVYALLENFNNDFALDQKAFINKKIDKLLRIKNSNNTQYILATAQELLEAIKDQEKELKARGLKDKQLELAVKTQNLLKELNRNSKPKTISEDIVTRINIWESKHKEDEQEAGFFEKFSKSTLLKIKNIFETPPEILVIKEQIKSYNKQLFEFAKLYFKESSSDYRSKVKLAIKTIWKARTKAKHSLKYAKISIKKRHQQEKEKAADLSQNLMDEINLFSGWLLSFYLIFYFVSLYLTTKDFGITNIPQAFHIYETQIMKHILAFLFILHSATAIKVNFFKGSKLANIIIFPLFIFSSIVAIINF